MQSFTPRAYANALYETVKALPEKEVPPMLRRLLHLLRRRRQWAMLPKIMRAFGEVLYEQEGLLEVELITARPHGAAHEKEWVKRALDMILPAMGKRRVELTRTVDPRLIGGMKMRTREYAYDGSVRRYLDALRARLRSVPIE